MSKPRSRDRFVAGVDRSTDRDLTDLDRAVDLLLRAQFHAPQDRDDVERRIYASLLLVQSVAEPVAEESDQSHDALTRAGETIAELLHSELLGPTVEESRCRYQLRRAWQFAVLAGGERRVY